MKRNGHNQQTEHDELGEAIDSVLREPIAVPSHLLARLQGAGPQRPPGRRRLLLVAGIGACAAGYGGLTILSAFALGHVFAAGILPPTLVLAAPHLPALNRIALTGGAVLAWGTLGLAVSYATQSLLRH
ncbi:MAG: hypothetical protein ACYCVB_01470 [Bacilli bacterium]